MSNWGTPVLKEQNLAVIKISALYFFKVKGIFKLYHILHVRGFLASGPLNTGMTLWGKIKEGG